MLITVLDTGRRARAFTELRHYCLAPRGCSCTLSTASSSERDTESKERDQRRRRLATLRKRRQSRLAVADMANEVSAFLHFGQGSDHTLHLDLRGSFVNIARQETFVNTAFYFALASNNKKGVNF